MRRVLLACVGLAAVSLLLGSEPSYDPWAWIVWGRETATFALDTTGGPSWKPLPVLFTTAFAPTGAISDGLPPALWLVVARAGTLFAFALAFKLTARLIDGPRAIRWSGGAVAALALALTPDWLRYAAHGNEVPLAIALMLWAVDRGLDREHREALLLGFAACLLRPEAFPFLAAYGAWAWWSLPARRALIAGLGIGLVALWLGPEWIGSGHPFDASDQARSEPTWSLSLEARPWLAALGRAHELTGPVLQLGLLAAVVAGVRSSHGARARTVLALGGAALGWVALVAAMTELGFSGSPRYFMPAVTCACLLTGVAFAGAVGQVVGLRHEGKPRRAGPLRAATLVGLAAVIAITAVPWARGRGEGIGDQARAAERLAHAEHGLAEAVRAVGGPEAVVSRGAPRVGRQFQTRLAWETQLTLGEVERASGPGLRFVARPREGSRALVIAPGCDRRVAPAGGLRDWCVAIAGTERSPVHRGGRGRGRL